MTQAKSKRRAAPQVPLVEVPLRYPTALMFIDESGSKGSGSKFFVMGMVKVRQPGLLLRSLASVRDKHRFRDEFRFGSVTERAMPAYLDAVDALARSDARIAAFVYDKEKYDPFPGKEVWEVHASAAYQLVFGNLNKTELVSLLLDVISTPTGIAIDEIVRSRVNGRTKAQAVITSACLDSRSSDGLQMADLVASCIAYERRSWAGQTHSPPNASSPKARLTRHLRTAFDLDSFHDDRTDRVNILTSRARSPRRLASAR